MQLHRLLVLAFAATVSATGLYKRVNDSNPWYLERFSNFIVFGDSYTDENRLNYFASHNGSAPPAGTYLPESLGASDGGRIWARYVIQYTGSNVGSVFTPALTLYNYAVSGAVCSNLESPRTFQSINAPFPDLELYEVPAFLADKAFVDSSTGQGYFQPALTDSNAVYAIFDGTNDVGNYAYLTDSQVPGNTLTSYTDCIYSQLDKLYASGGRFFVLINLFPLDLAPQYANLSAGGVTADKFWPDKPENVTLYYERMLESVSTVNSIFQYRTPYEAVIANRYPGANFANFDVHSLVSLHLLELCVYQGRVTEQNGLLTFRLSHRSRTSTTIRQHI